MLLIFDYFMIKPLFVQHFTILVLLGWWQGVLVTLGFKKNQSALYLSMMDPASKIS